MVQYVLMFHLVPVYIFVYLLQANRAARGSLFSKDSLLMDRCLVIELRSTLKSSARFYGLGSFKESR